MLFNSRPFLLVFLPLTLLVVLGLRRAGRDKAAQGSLIAASLFFYGWWSVKYLLLLLSLLTFNYLVARALLWANADEKRERVRLPVLVFGLVTNIATLGYFKYTNFIFEVLDHHSPIHVKLGKIILPLGLSFITFQKIAFLADIYSGAVPGFALLDYALFVTFFPQLIAGPIVHHSEVFPQFSRPTALRYGRQTMAAGITLFVIGLFKKAVLADGVASAATVVFTAAAQGKSIDFFAAWGGALSYMLQLYFDFSAYSDMAIGLGMMFGINLPFNFNSPYKASNVIEFWQRWHISLTRFLTAYIYNPILVGLTRRRVAKGQSVITRKGMTVGAFLALQAFPTFVTMMVSGIWHGAGFQYIAFGLLHGGYLIINHAFRAIQAARGAPAHKAGTSSWWGRILTLLAVLVAEVFFRADTLHAARAILKAMVGRSGFVLPRSADPVAVGFAVVLLLVTQFAPNSQELLGPIMTRLRAAGTKRAAQPEADAPKRWYAPVWRPTAAWGLALAVVGFYSILQISGASEFLYFNF
jgi:alginate O-acetyltransferase complex protein AlgI